MCAQPSFDWYPSIGEFSGLYNVPGDFGDLLPIWCSVDNPPEFGFPEHWAIYQAALKWFSKAVPSAAANEPFYISEHDVFVPRDETDDRTQSIDNVDYARLDLQLLRRIQREFLGRYPLWRVYLVGEDAATSIVVYPTVIRFGDRPASMDPEEALRELIPRGAALREAYYRPRCAYLAHLRRMLPEAVRAIEDRRFLIFGVLDSWDGHFDVLTVLLLIRAADDHVVTMEGPAEAGERFLSTCGTLGVDAEGAIVCSGPVPDEVPFCFSPWLPPADYRGPLTVLESDTGKRHVYEIKSENIIRTLPQE